MAKTKPLTKNDLLDVLAEFYTGHLKPEFEEIKRNTDGRFEEVNQKIDLLTTEMNWVKQELKGLTGEFSKMVSMKEFNKLRQRVDGYHPRN